MVIINDRIKKEEEILLDQGFFFGKGVFETILVKDEPIFLNEHFSSLCRMVVSKCISTVLKMN